MFKRKRKPKKAPKTPPPEPPPAPTAPPYEEESGSMGLLDHLEELRRCIMNCVYALILGMIISIPFMRDILNILTAPLAKMDVNPDTYLVVPEVMGGFKVAVSLAFWSGLLLASPFIVFFVARFVFPGLHRHEKRMVSKASVAAVLLFFLGAALGYFGTVERALQALIFGIHEWLGTRSDWIYLTSYIAFTLKLVLGFGLAFQLPIVLLMLGFSGLVDSDTLKTSRKQVFVGLLIMAMLLTPPEPMSQIIMASALYLLYEICLVLIRAHEKRHG